MDKQFTSAEWLLNYLFLSLQALKEEHTQAVYKCSKDGLHQHCEQVHVNSETNAWSSGSLGLVQMAVRSHIHLLT